MDNHLTGSECAWCSKPATTVDESQDPACLDCQSEWAAMHRRDVQRRSDFRYFLMSAFNRPAALA